jgi:hypothetical protein
MGVYSGKIPTQAQKNTHVVSRGVLGGRFQVVDFYREEAVALCG